MTRKRVDANPAEIVEALRLAGCSVLDIHEVGDDCPDLLVGAPRGATAIGGQVAVGANILMVVKSARGRLSPGQKEFFASWPGPKAVVRNIIEALAAVGTTGIEVARIERHWAQVARR